MGAAAPSPPVPLTGLGQVLDRCAEHRDDGTWIEALARRPEACHFLLDASGEAFVEAGRDVLLRIDPATRERLFADTRASLVGIAHGVPWLLLVIARDERAATLEAMLGARRMSLRAAGLLLGAEEAALFAYAKGLVHWQQETRFCSHCGAPLLLVAAGHRMQCTRSDCARVHFPRTDPAVIMLVEHAGACLLGRQAGWGPGRWSTLAGFVEPGETLEDAVRREVAEESGVQVGAVHYLASQPWPMPRSLMLGFLAQARDRHIQRRDHELEDVRWFTPEEIVHGIAAGSFVPSTRLSVSHLLLAHWLRLRAGLELDALPRPATSPAG